MENKELNSEIFKKIRKELGLSQPAMAEKLGLGARQYQNYEWELYDAATDEEQTATTNGYLNKARELLRLHRAGKLDEVPMEQVSTVAEKIIRLEAEAERLEQYAQSIKESIRDIKLSVMGRQP